MTEDLTQSNYGKIIFWNSIYGFIQTNDNSSIFFHKSKVLIDNIQELQLLDEVSYETEIVEHGMHKGKMRAINVVKTKDANLSDYQRYIGRITKWNNRYCFIKSPQQEKTVLFYHRTRNLYKNVSFKPNDLVIFHQVKSSKDQNQLFALFAYPISKEENVSFLQQQYSDSHIEEIKEYITKLISKRTDLSPEETFYENIMNLGFIDDQDSYFRLISIIKEAEERNYQPKFDLLKNYCSTKYLIQLWEEEIIVDYDIEIICQYFHNTSANNKRVLISKFHNDDKKEILNYHFEHLKIEGKLQYLNNRVKTLLDLVYRNTDSREIEIYNNIKDYLFKQSKPEELINLWLGGYIDFLTERFIIENLDIDNHQIIQTLLNRQEEKYTEVLKKIYENYFLKLTKTNFEDELPQLVKRLKIFEMAYRSRYQEITSVIRNVLDDDMLFVLWIFGVSIDFDALDYFEKNHQTINDYYKIRFFITYDSDANDDLMMSLLEKVKISQEGIIDFVSNNPWNNLISPTEIVPDNDSVYFIKDLELFLSTFNITNNIDIKEISLSIFNLLPKYQVHHIRLWLYSYVDEKLYDYIGFREAYKELTSVEQSRFKDKGEKISYTENVIKPEIQVVEPCSKIIAETNETKTYLATIPNLYFGNGYFKLRIEDKSYTNEKKEKYASSGFNRISKSSYYSKLPIEIEVDKKETKIINVKGLKEVFAIIHTDEIEEVLGIVDEPGDEGDDGRNKSYVEDWQLRKQILDFLNKSQIEQCEPESVNEPKNFFRRLDEESGIDKEELTRLYTLETADGYGIIWENIDLTEDRATYIFKTKKEFHKLQLEKIAHRIASFAQFRSALISTKEDERLQIFKDNLGFVGSIRKQRGRNQSYENWLNKLNKHLSRPIPVMPTDEELESLKNWSPRIPHSPRITRTTKQTSKKPKTSPIPPKPINEEDTPIVDLPFDNEKIHSPKSKPDKKDHDKEHLLSALKAFNELFLEKIKYDTNGQ